jgi:hypothetical protein
MPINGSRRLRDDALWGKVLEDMIKDGTTELPPYIPGLLMFPDPSAGIIIGYIDIGFWAVFLYPFSSIVYCLSSGFSLDPSLLSDDVASTVNDTYYYSSTIDDYFINDDNISNVLSNYLNLVAAVILLFDSWLGMYDWHLQRTYPSLSFRDLDVKVNDSHSDLIIITELSDNDSIYYFLNNLFFFGAAIIYVIQAMWIIDVRRTDLLNCCESDWCAIFWVNFWGSMGYRKRFPSKTHMFIT